MQERDHEIENEPPKGRVLGPRVGSEVYRPSGSFKLHWRVWEVGPGGRSATLEVVGSAFTRRGARRAVTRAIRGFQRGVPAQETWAAGPTRNGRTFAAATEPAVTTAGGHTPKAAHQGAKPEDRVMDRSISTDVATEAPATEAPEADDRLAAILVRVEELQRSIAGVVERLDASAEALESPGRHGAPETDPAEREPTHPRVAHDA